MTRGSAERTWQVVLAAVAASGAWGAACGGGSTPRGPAGDAAGDPGAETGDPGLGGPEADEEAGAGGDENGDAGETATGDPAGEPVEGGFGWPCTSNADCASGYCVEGAEGPVCTVACQLECPADWVCRATLIGSDVVSLCMPLGVDLCRPCKLDTQCGDGACIEVDGAKVCGRDCAERPCPEGYDCTDVEVGPDRAAGRQCVPSSGACDCTVTSDGATRPCARGNDVGSCLGYETCDAAAGWTCDAPEAKAEECNGEDDDCDGVADDDPAAPGPSCQIVTEGVGGACAGTWSCRGKDGWSCVGQKPAAEACNWLDDDCDGKTDEEFTSEDGRYTDLHNCGGCGRDCEGSIPFAKTIVCDATSEIPACRATACAPGYEVNPSGICLPPLTNLCAPCASDDDCGGTADRCVELGDGRFCGRDCSPLAVGGQCPAEYDCKDLGAGVRQCVPASGSCTCNSATQGAKRACARENDAGTCYGSELCDPVAGWVGCTAAVPAPESCNGKDDNCDSLVDEAFPALGSPCSDGTGECLRTGKLSCRPDGTGLECDATAAAPGTELCNAKDDDCDGLADEDWPEVGRPCTAGTGACTEVGTWGCRDDALGPECDAVPGQGGPESCNYQDDDCDGATDEDWTEGGRYVAHVACGNCFADCRAIWWSAAHHANGVCDAGPATPVCTYECDSGWADADLNPVNGCELWVDPSAVFVATPDNGGTSALDCGAWNRPCSTIGRGIAQAVASWKARVLVSEGMYAENVVLANGVSVLGGHNAVTWQRDPYTNLTIIQGSTPDPLVRDKVAVKAQSIVKATELSGFTIYGESNFWYQKGARGGTSHAVMLVDCGSALVVRDNRVYAGRGSAGSDGTNGATGSNGLDGKPGLNCKSAGTNQCSGVTNAGGAGATSTCGVAGGKGGTSVCPSGNNQMPAGSNGSGPYAGDGGEGGHSDQIRGSCTVCSTGGFSDFGYDGGKGGPGSNGGAGAGCSATAGTLAGGTTWTPDDSAGGGDGTAGSGGGGGGGGGGVDFLHTACSGGNDHLGSSGGGGGAGGCGGVKGGAGLGGGASIAILVARSDALGPGPLPVLQDNAVYRNQGGAGGRGGAGGTGGIGGSGAVAGDVNCTAEWYKSCVGQGGTGGDGGMGGSGGGGGGGCGGPSFGILVSAVHGGTGSACSSNQFGSLGDGGAGGQGGNSVGNAGKAGAAGTAQDCLAL